MNADRQIPLCARFLQKEERATLTANLCNSVKLSTLRADGFTAVRVSPAIVAASATVVAVERPAWPKLASRRYSLPRRSHTVRHRGQSSSGSLCHQPGAAPAFGSASRRPSGHTQTRRGTASSYVFFTRGPFLR